MKPFKIKSMISVFFLSVVLSISCSDDDSSAKDIVTLIAGTNSKDWRVAAFSTDSEPGNCYSSSPVIQDDTYTFFVDGIYSIDVGELRTLPGDECQTDDSATGIWSFNATQDSIIFTLHDDPSVYDILVLEADTMVLASSAEFWVSFVPR